MIHIVPTEIEANTAIDAPQTLKPVYRTLPIHYLQSGKYQPRENFDRNSIESLAESIKKLGMLEPIVTRPTFGSKKYEIIAGERRWRAAQLAGLHEIPCLISEYTDEQAAQIAIVENTQREQLNIIELARSIEKFIIQFNYTHDEVAAFIGKNRTTVTNLLRLLKLDERVQEMLEREELTEAHGKAIAGVSVHKQYAIAKTCADKKWSTKILEKEIKKIKTNEPIGKKKAKDANISDIERRLSDHLGYQVEIYNNTNNMGYIKLNYHNLDNFESILERLGFKYE